MNPVQILMMNQQKSVNLSYGLLYNWYAGTDSRNIAPTGWVLSADESALVITHGLNSRSKVVKVLSKNGTTSNCVELQGNVAYSTKTDIYGTGYNAIRLDAFATVTTELYVEIIL